MGLSVAMVHAQGLSKSVRRNYEQQGHSRNMHKQKMYLSAVQHLSDAQRGSLIMLRCCKRPTALQRRMDMHHQGCRWQ